MKVVTGLPVGDFTPLTIPEGPWLADVWLMPRPIREATATSQPCLVTTCEGTAGTPEGERPADRHRLCAAHQRRMRKANRTDTDAFAKEQAVGKPILKPRGARNRVEHLPPVDFTRVHPRFAEELRWVIATKIRRSHWRGDAYVDQLLREALSLAEDLSLVHVSDLGAVVEAASDSEKVRIPRVVRLGVPSMVEMLSWATADPWSSLYWHPRDHPVSDMFAPETATVSWKAVTCLWLRDGLMTWGRQCIQSGSRSWGTVASFARAGSLFSEFVDEVGDVDPQDLTRAVFLDFLSWVRSEDGSRSDLIGVNLLARLLVDLREEDIVPDLPDTTFLRRGENAIRKTRAPKPFPDDILSRIDDLVADPAALDDDVRLLLRVFRAVCPRANEAFSLPLNCIEHSARGYTLAYFQKKTKSWRRVPLPEALGKDLVKQAERVRERHPGCVYLFPYLGSQPRLNTLLTSAQDANALGPWRYQRFSATVWAAYKRAGITKSSTTGETLTGAQLHRFRHSVATDLLKESWSQYEVQKFLGHSSPTMMQSYAEIHEDSLRAKYEEFVKHSVDVAGEHKPVDTAALGDVERMRDRMVRSALPNGYCTLPDSQTCDFVPSPCLTCTPFFRTTPTFLPIHIRQRDESMRELELAKESGRERAIDAHARTLEALNKIIEGLEAEEAS